MDDITFGTVFALVDGTHKLGSVLDISTMTPDQASEKLHQIADDRKELMMLLLCIKSLQRAASAMKEAPMHLSIGTGGGERKAPVAPTLPSRARKALDDKDGASDAD
jgi:hypothetical protein